MKTRKLLVILTVITISLGFGACHELADCVRGNSDLTTEVRDVPSFNGIALEGSFEVQVVLGDKNEVVVEAESNLMHYIQTRVEGRTLVVKTKTLRCINTNYPIIITITTTDLESIKLSGSGIITATNIDVEELEVDLVGSGIIDITAEVDYLDARISGSGDILLVGHAIESELKISGSGSVRAYDFEHDKSYVSISGSGDMYLFINEFLDVRISGSGSVYYLGDPTVNSSISGSGSVIKTD